jgi:uncharacterized repeat protein (TIGR02543 family)
MFKRLLVVITLFLMVTGSAWAVALPQLDIGSATYAAGATTVTVPVSLTNVSGTGLASVGTTIKFDTTKLRFSLISTGPAGTAAGKSASGGIDPNDPTSYNILVFAFNTTAIGDGVVAYVTFDILTSGTTTLTNVGPNGSDTTADGNPVTLTGSDGTISVILAGQTIGNFSFNPASLAVGGTTTASATGGGSGNPVVFTSTTPAACTVSGTNGSTITAMAAGTCTIAASQAGNANYNPAPPVNQNITVGVGSQSITNFLPPVGSTYGDAPIILGANASSGLPVGFALVSGPATLTNGTTLTITGGGNVVVKATQAGDSNYAAALEVQRTIVVAPKALTITADAKTKVYGGADPGLTYQVTNGALVGSDVLTGTLTRAAGENAGSYAIQPGTVSAGANYALTYVPTNLSVTAKPLTITASNASRIYAAANPANPGFTAPALATGDILSGVTYTYAATATATANTGTTHAITPSAAVFSAGSASNYTIAYVDGTLTIAGTASQTISFTAPASKTYGDVPITLGATATSGLPVSFALVSGPATLTNGTTLTITGAGSIVVKATQAGDNNYAAATDVPQTIVVSPKALTITADAKTKIYGAADPGLTYSVTGALVGSDAFTGTLSRAAGENTGSYAIQKGTVSAGSNYTLTYAAANLTITAKTITITADAKTKVYGATDPALTYQITSGALVGGDAFTGTLTRAAGENAGSYAIQPGTVSAGANYALTYVPANLTITAKPLTITASNASRIYAAANPANPGFTAPALAAGDIISGVTYTYAATATATANTGTTHAITPSAAVFSTGSASNYVITYVDGTLTISKASQTIGAISFTPATLPFGGTTAASATATSSLGVSFNSTTPAACTVSGSTVQAVTVGTCTIAADQVGDGNYNPASQVTKNITVNAIAPGAPNIGIATGDYGQAKVTFTAPALDGGSAITRYTVTSTPGNITAIGTGSPITVTGLLTDGRLYTFTVTAKNAIGEGAPSFASNPVTAIDTIAPVVRSFSVPGSVGAPDTALSTILSISSFNATDNVSVTGYLVTNTTDKPAADATGWSAIVPTGYAIDTAPGEHSIYAWAKDAAGNVSTPYSALVVITPIDTTKPVIISGPTVTSVSNTTAVVEWQTNEPAKGGLSYGLTSPPATTGPAETDFLTSHSLTISGLKGNTDYYVSVSASDHSGNGPTLSAAVPFHTKVDPDTIAPFVTEGPALSSIGPDAATVQWHTNEPAKGNVFFGTTNTLGQSVAETEFTTTHSVKLTGLTPETIYYLKVSATDQANNGPRESGMASFATVALPDTTAPAIVEGPMVVNISDTGATVIWRTDEPSSSVVITNSGGTIGFFSTGGLTTSHSVTLTGLTASASYSYKVSSTDGSGNGPTTSTSKTFATPAAPDTAPPVILEGPLVVNVTHQSAVIRWGTDEPADSAVVYGKTNTNFDSSESRTALVRTHNLTLTGLEAGTTYHFRALSTDSFGNGPTVSKDFTFTTDQKPVYKKPVITVPPRVVGKTNKTITVYWETDEPCDSMVAYGANNSLNNFIWDDEMVTAHQITIANLLKSTAYRVAVYSTNANGNTVSAKAGVTAQYLAFNDLAGIFSDAGAGGQGVETTTNDDADTTMPVIIGEPTVSGITDTQAIISWTTEEIADSQVSFGQSQGLLNLAAGDIKQKTKHEMTLTNLTKETKYYFQVSSTDSSNLAASSAVLNFTTTAGADTTPPGFIGSLVASAIVGDKATIGWTTNEPATSQIMYGLSADSMTSPAVKSGLSTDHLLTLALQPGTTYFAKAVAMDGSGNVGESATISFDTLGSPDVAAPATTLSATGGTGARTVTLEANEPTNIYYTTDGSTPTASSAVYNGPINVTSSKTFKFFAIDAAGNQEAAKSVAVVVTHTVTPATGANGSISPATPQTVDDGSPTSFNVTPTTGYSASVTGCGGSLSGTTYTTGAITGDCTVTASFSLMTFTVNFTSGGNGTISGTAGQTVNYGANAAQVTAVLASGYHFVNWTGTNGFTATSSNPLTVTNVTANQTITANFTADPINGACGGSNGGTFTLAPATNLCSAGNSTNVTGAGPWNWSCTGLNTGTTASCSAGIQAATPTTTLLGDINGDGKVDIADALLALRVAVELVPMDSKYLANGDCAPYVNGKSQPDKKIDIGDALVILRKVVGTI